MNLLLDDSFISRDSLPFKQTKPIQVAGHGESGSGLHGMGENDKEDGWMKRSLSGCQVPSHQQAVEKRTCVPLLYSWYLPASVCESAVQQPKITKCVLFSSKFGFYDTFPNPQRSHIIRRALYRNIISMHSPWAIPREPGGRRPPPSKIHRSWAWAWCPEHGPVSDVNQRLMQDECSTAAFILRGSMENRSRGRAHVPSLPYPPLSLHLQNKCEHDSGGRILILKQPQKIRPWRRRYSTVGPLMLVSTKGKLPLIDISGLRNAYSLTNIIGSLNLLFGAPGFVVAPELKFHLWIHAHVCFRPDPRPSFDHEVT